MEDGLIWKQLPLDYAQFRVIADKTFHEQLLAAEDYWLTNWYVAIVFFPAFPFFPTVALECKAAFAALLLVCHCN